MFSKKQKDFLFKELSRVNLLYGSVRSGKTWISLLKWAIWVGEQPVNQEFLMVGKTLTTLKRNCLGLLETLIGEENISYSLSQKKAVIFGRTVWLEGANDTRCENKIRGMTLKGVYIDELTLIPKDFYLMALSRLSLKGAKLIATTNPESPNSYVYKDIIKNQEIDKLVVKFLISDNPYLDAEYIENLKKEYTGVFYKRFIDGDFCVAEGAIYSVFTENKDKILIGKDKVPTNLKYINMGVDFGGNKSNHAFVATGITEDFKEMYKLKSISLPAVGIGVDVLIDQIVFFANRIVEDYGFLDGIYCDSAEQTIINTLRSRCNFNIYNSVKNPIIDRIRTTCFLMGCDRFFIVEEENQSLIGGYQDACWDNKLMRDFRLDNGSYNVDILDADEYSWEYYINFFGGD